MAGVLFWKEKCVEDGFRGKRSVWRMVQRSRFPLKRKGRSFHVEGPTTEKAREPTEESLVGVMPVGTKSIRSRAGS